MDTLSSVVPTHCTGQSLMDLALPVLVFTVAATYLCYRRWIARKKSLDPKPLLPVTWVSKATKAIQFILGLVEVGGWTYFLIQQHGKTDNICVALGPLSYLLAWLGVSVLVATAPAYNEFKSGPYIHVFAAYYLYSFLDGVYKAFVPENTSSFLAYWALTHVLISLVLFVIIGVTPLPLNPRNTETVPQEKFEIKEGWVYRNDLPLSPESTASIFSWALFQWVNKLVLRGFSNTVAQADLYSMTFQHLSRTVYDDYLATKKTTAQTNVLLRLYRSNCGVIWVQVIFSTASVLVAYASPYFQQKFLEYLENPNGRPISIAYVYVFGLFSVAIVKLLCDGLQLWAGRRWNIRTMTMLDTELLEKTLKRRDMSGKVGNTEKEGESDSKDKKKEEAASFSNTGKITNLMAIDANSLSMLPSYIFMFYNAPLQVVVAIVYLYKLLGTAALVGLATMLLSFPFTWWLTSILTKTYEGLSNARDKRSDLVNELLQGIRMIKYFAWETNWEKKISDARNTEIKNLIKTLSIEIVTSITFTSLPVLVTASTFIWYTKVQGHPLTASVAFVSITLFDMLRQPMFLIPDSIDTLSQAYVSLKRLVRYLKEPEVDSGSEDSPVSDNSGGIATDEVLARVGFEKSVFQWYSAEPTSSSTSAPSSSSASTDDDTLVPASAPAAASFQLNIPSFDFPIGKLSIVCGATGSGKSSFLSALLGEMDLVSGRAYLPSKNKRAFANQPSIDPVYPSLYLDKVAYVAQQPFLRHASIRDNILFGLPFDPVRYKKVLAQCALVKDLEVLSDGDRTEIGEKGISLSGGQKQRVSIARAVYSYAKTVLLDDCLSAVDAHTAKHIYEHCLTGDLLRGRTVILVTHHVRLCLPSAKFLLKLANGNVAGYGSVETLKQTKELNQLIGNESQNDEILDEDAEEANVPYNEDFELGDEQAEAKKLVQDEKSEQGSVKFKVYTIYLAACGGVLFWSALYFSYIVARGFDFGENWWLRIWAGSNATQAHDNAQDNGMINLLAMSTKPMPGYAQQQQVFQIAEEVEGDTRGVDFYIGIYLLICFSGIIFQSMRTVLLYWGSIRGAKKLFSSMLHRIIHAPMRFFDTTPVGRVLNRFGQDISVIDTQMARSASHMIYCLTGFIAAIAVIIYITPEFLVVAAIILVIYCVIGLYYLRISRELKRFTSVNRSPIYSHFTESLVGVTTIRAYGLQEQFLFTIYEKLDAYNGPFYLLWMTNRWLYARIEFAGAFVTLFAGILILVRLDKVDAGMAGISLFYARNFLEQAYWFIRQYTQVEMNLNSVERVQEYLEIDQEPPAMIENRRPPAAWPTTASVEVKDLVVRYAPDLDPVLHGVSFSVKPHEKIGVVGRTGSGKSTLALSFFRFLEASSGSVAIDGIDISHIGVYDLRSKLTIIPQDAVLFSGTIRSNLDPFNQHDDTELWESLKRVHLASANRSSGTCTPTDGSVEAVTSLSQPVSDGGNNFSQGQRQLLCLARALLKNSKFIIMDEATASVDFDTDSKIQTTIREEFVSSTLLCIAHRLRTVIDYDRVLVLDQGNLVEYDTPYNLLMNDAGLGVFKSMCEKSGEMDVLLDMVQQSTSRQQEEFPTPDIHHLM